MRSEVNEELTSGSVEFKDENYKGDAIFNLTPEIAMYSPFSQCELKSCSWSNCAQFFSSFIQKKTD